MPSFTTEESRELDAFLDERLFSCIECADARRAGQIRYVTGGDHAHGRLAYSTSYEGMGAVLEAMRARGFQCALSVWVNECVARFEPDGGLKVGPMCSNPHVPTAVALAAKAWLESETGSSS